MYRSNFFKGVNNHNHSTSTSLSPPSAFCTSIPFRHRNNQFPVNKHLISNFILFSKIFTQTSMESDGNDAGNNNFLDLEPVAPEMAGEGLPYAPENFPNPGDMWRWKVGKRISNNGNYRDRYLYLPRRLSKPTNQTSYRGGFASKLAVERYVREKFPKANISDFFASFSWTIPSGLAGNMNATTNGNPAADDLFKQFELDVQVTNVPSDIPVCKAGNHKCNSLNPDKENPAVIQCEFCCAEPKFCRDCCCILCYKPVDSAHGGYGYIMCKVEHGEDICGHITHLECGFRAYTAGTVRGMIGLDAEFFCNRCNGRTELISHVNEILLACEAVDSEDVKGKMLSLGFNLLDGSEKAAAKELVGRIRLAMSKLKHGSTTEDILSAGDKVTDDSSGFADNAMAATEDDSPLNPSNVEKGKNYAAEDQSRKGKKSTAEDQSRKGKKCAADDQSPSNHSNGGSGKKNNRYRSETSKLDSQYDRTLKGMRKAQKQEYKLAEERLRTHTRYIQSLCQQLIREEAELTSQPNASPSSELFQNFEKHKEEFRLAKIKFEEMKKIANGFGNTSKSMLEKHFGI